MNNITNVLEAHDRLYVETHGSLRNHLQVHQQL